MRQVEETQLPGVGVRYSFVTSQGQRLSVLHHRSGHREVFSDLPHDPDAGRQLLDLDERDSEVLAELLGGSQVQRELDRLEQEVSGLAIDWLDVDAGSPADGRTIDQLQVRATTGVTVVTVVRGGDQHPNPAPDFRFAAGDTAVVLGAPDDLRRVRDLLRG